MTSEWSVGLFERSPALLARAEADGTLSAVNPAFAAALGCNRDELLGARFAELAHPDDRAAIAHALDVGPGHAEQRFAHADGTWRVLRWQATRAGDGTLELAAADVTADRLELAAVAAAIGHGLRAPLRAIDGFSKVLLAGDNGLPEETARYLALVREAGSDMALLLDGLMRVLDVSRATLAPQPADPAQIAREVIDLVLRDRQGDRCVEWTVEELPPCRADVPLLRRLFEELLGNALKFGARHVAVGYDAATNAYTITDDGVGFDDSQANRAFEIFGRLHPADTFPGAGAGLAVAERIVARQGGTITARSTPHHGTTIAFTLPGCGRRDSNPHDQTATRT